MITIPSDQPFQPVLVPSQVAACPICGAAICVESIDEWDSENGKPEHIGIDCVTSPDIDGDKWDDWFREHWRDMPYTHWIPVEKTVLKWFLANYRVQVHG